MEILIEQLFGLVGMITKDARCTHETHCITAMTKTAFNKKILSATKLDLHLRKKLVKCYISGTGFVRC